MIISYIKARLVEPTTWRGIVLIITAAGAKLNPEQTEAIIGAGLALAGLLGVFLPDPKTEAKK